MSTSSNDRQLEAQGPARRSFLTRLLAIGATLGVGGSVGARQALAEEGGTAAADEPWMTRLKGTQRVVFHSHLPTDGLALTWARTFIETQKNTYGRTDAESGVIVGLNGRSIGLLFNDAMWSKYPIAQTMGMTGSANPNGPGGSNLVAQLLERGVILLVCQNSLRASGSRFLPEPARSDEKLRTAFAEEAKANLLPGVEVVPAMIVTLQQAQDRGCRYVYAGG